MNKFLVISFKSRNELFSFVKFLRENGIIAQIINTPRIVSHSCGLSAKTNEFNYSKLVNLLSLTKPYGFLGLFLITRLGLQEKAERLY